MYSTSNHGGMPGDSCGSGSVSLVLVYESCACAREREARAREARILVTQECSISGIDLAVFE